MRFTVDFQPMGQDRPTHYSGQYANSKTSWDRPVHKIPNYVKQKFTVFLDTYAGQFDSLGVGERMPLALCIGITINDRDTVYSQRDRNAETLTTALDQTFARIEGDM